MKYITGKFALNLNCTLNTCGDWHQAALNWDKIAFADTNTMFFKDYGIESHKKIPEHEEEYYVANHIRACLDLIEQGKFSVVEGMNKDFICDSFYDNEIFDKVYSMRSLSNWEKINSFMYREYRTKWLKYVKDKEV